MIRLTERADGRIDSYVAGSLRAPLPPRNPPVPPAVSHGPESALTHSGELRNQQMAKGLSINHVTLGGGWVFVIW